MNITKENTGEYTATIKIEVASPDYEKQVSTSLKELQKKSSLKGFRPGKVPAGLIKKMYGQNVLTEEVNKVLSESLNNYIVENKLEILGYPLSSKEKQTAVDFENDTDFDFYFDIALIPEVPVVIDDTIEVDYYAIKVDDEQVDKYVADTAKRFGNPGNPEAIEKGDLVKADAVQADANGKVLDEGWSAGVSLSVEFIKDEKIQNEFIGSKVGDSITWNPLKATENETETASMLGIKKEEKEKLESDYTFTITEISRVEPAEINEDLFKKVYPAGDVNTEEDFREKLREEAKKYFQNETDNFFVHETMEKITHDTEINLPEEFIKRWLIESDEHITEETVEEDYEGYKPSLKQQLIIGQIAKDHEIKVELADVRNHIKDFFAKQYMMDFEDEEKSKQLDGIVDSVMKNEEETKKIYDQLFDQKIRGLFKEKLKLNTVEMSYDEFIKKVDEHHHHNHQHHEHE